MTITSHTEVHNIRNKKEMMLIHNGEFAKAIPVLPRVETSTLSVGWDDDKVQAFVKAMKQVVIENPILTSHLIKKKNSIYACPGTFSPEKHKFVTVVDESESGDNINIRDLKSTKERLDFIQQFISSKLGDKKSSGSNDIKTKCPLFHAYLFRFSDGYACYHIGISHALVDGHTYYLIIDQISSFMNQEEVTKINWGNPGLTTHEAIPDHYTKKDKKKIGPLPMILGIVRYAFCAGKKKKHTWWICSKEELNIQKDEQLESGTEYISSHDLIISAISRAIKSSDEIGVNMNNRLGDRSSFSLSDGGNCVKMITMPCEAVSNPNLCRKTMNKGYYYGANEVKSKAVKRGRVCYTTTWATGYKLIQGVSTICHSPSLKFAQSVLPCDFCIIFALDDDSLGVLTNFLEVDNDELGKMEKWIKVLD